MSANSDSSPGCRRRILRSPERQLLLALAAVLAATGCGSVRASIALNDAEQELAAAQAAGEVEQLAPYELASAEAYLEEARLQQGHADYERAIAYAHKATEFASQAKHKVGGTDEVAPPPRVRTIRAGASSSGAGSTSSSDPSTGEDLFAPRDHRATGSQGAP